ncbi:MAG: dimethyl sulfoxide reductase anchor subunit [Proteobacteria bacterium]|nr:dimethyl sulfoxide reductase anchor subunit [Pseudomonadota bacterium]MDE3208787.1 dimethyl sulfoxide reductase anchor subunit [Pseudomonadota bacterium]
MNPAFSVIFLTTLIGVGQGLFLALYTARVLVFVGAIALPDSRSFFVLGSAISLFFLASGLTASFFHLGHPERAWRAVMKWRTSWLSREVIVLPVFMLTVFLYGLMCYLGWQSGSNRIAQGVVETIGALAAVLCIVLFICTGMVYASIRFLQEWASPLTLINYFLLGSMSGYTLAAGFSAFLAPHLMRMYACIAFSLIVISFMTRVASLYRNARIRPCSTVQTATGIYHPKVVQKAQGSMGGSFNTRHYFHGKTRQVIRSVKWIFPVLVFVLPALLLAGSLSDIAHPFLLIVTFVIQYVGLLAERWFFFAQANHPQNLYYQQVS